MNNFNLDEISRLVAANFADQDEETGCINCVLCNECNEKIDRLVNNRARKLICNDAFIKECKETFIIEMKEKLESKQSQTVPPKKKQIAEKRPQNEPVAKMKPSRSKKIKVTNKSKKTINYTSNSEPIATKVPTTRSVTTKKRPQIEDHIEVNNIQQKKRNLNKVDAAADDEDDEVEVVEYIQKKKKNTKIVDNEYIVNLARSLKENVIETEAFLKQNQNKSFELTKNDVAPKINLATTEEGEKFLNDVKKLEEVFSSSSEFSANKQSPLEKIGTLSRWWKICRRSLSISGIFDVLKSRKKSQNRKNQRKTIQQMYSIEIEKIKQLSPLVRCYSFRHALVYSKLGKFLSKHHFLLNQTLLVSLVDWTNNIIIENIDKNKNKVVLDFLDEIFTQN